MGEDLLRGAPAVFQYRLAIKVPMQTPRAALIGMNAVDTQCIIGRPKMYMMPLVITPATDMSEAGSIRIYAAPTASLNNVSANTNIAIKLHMRASLFSSARVRPSTKSLPF
jgi:fructose-1,6-bisphosphatase/sedoheptulose 1,7-bisphosphatase-like protein